jgi:hypothetical protein
MPQGGVCAVLALIPLYIGELCEDRQNVPLDEAGFKISAIFAE